jgi:hypothetical protein
MSKQHTKIVNGKRIWTTDSLLTLEGGDHVQIFDLLVYSFLEIGFTQHSYAHYTLDTLEIHLYNDSVGIFKVGEDEGKKILYRAEGMKTFWGVVREVWR